MAEQSVHTLDRAGIAGFGANFFHRIQINRGDYLAKSDYKITTAYLELRRFTWADLNDMLELRSDSKNNPFAPDDLWRSEQDAEDFYHFAALFYGNNPDRPDWFRYFFAIRKIGKEKVIGYCGIDAPDFDRQMTEIFYGLFIPLTSGRPDKRRGRFHKGSGPGCR